VSRTHQFVDIHQLLLLSFFLWT